MTRTLGELAAALSLSSSQPDLPITQVVADSRQVQPGALFVAYRGVQVDGHRFIDAAIQRGAVAVLGEKPLHLPVPYLQVPDARYALGLLAAAWHGWPGRRLGVIGVTGTDGKTTTSHLIDAILRAAGRRSAMLTTVYARAGNEVLDTGLHTTTPDALHLQGYLRAMVDAGSELAVLETTSHGLGQWRVAGIDYDIAVFTNVTHEHLDEHGSYEAYLAAKARLLELVAGSQPKPAMPRVAILNADDRSYEQLRHWAALPHISYGINAGDVRAHAIQQRSDGLRFTISGASHPPLSIQTPLRGRFNVYNCLAAVATAYALGIHEDAIVAGLQPPPAIPGRMEEIDRGQPFKAIVDFAHTPFALEAALQTARTLATGRVIVVFGSAGERDVAKRHMMGEVAGRLADLSIITAEDPRSEDLPSIMAASAAACRAAGGQALTIADRYQAIAQAVRTAREGDIVLVCGKGHEQSMCFGAKEYPWDDRLALSHALDVLMGVTNSPPPFRLPTAQTVV